MTQQGDKTKDTLMGGREKSCNSYDKIKDSNSVHRHISVHTCRLGGKLSEKI